MLVVDGLGQLAGATMLLVGLASTRTELVRNDLVAPSAKASSHFQLRPTPVVNSSSAGMGVVGTF